MGNNIQLSNYKKKIGFNEKMNKKLLCFFLWLEDCYVKDRTVVNNCRRSTENLFEKYWFDVMSLVVDVGSSVSWIAKKAFS